MPLKSHKFLQILFYAGLALLFCHELDAVARQEWRLLPGLNLLDDAQGLTVFVLLHFPFFIILLWLSTHENLKLRFRSQISIDTLMVIHGIAHFAMSGHQHYTFTPPVETITVYGAAGIAVLHLVLSLRHRSKEK